MFYSNFEGPPPAAIVGFIVENYLYMERMAAEAHAADCGRLASIRTRARDERAVAAHCFSLALSFLTERPKPVLAAVGGLSGSGKSAVASGIAPRIGAAPGAVILRTDVERKRLAGLPPTARGGAALYTADAGARTYARLQQLAAGALAAGVPVVVDAASLQHTERTAMQAVANACGAAFKLLVCQAPTEVLVQRVQARLQAGQDASDATPEVLTRQLDWVQWPGPDEAAHTLWLDTDAPLAEVLARVQSLPL
jgi:predicted kinase